MSERSGGRGGEVDEATYSGWLEPRNVEEARRELAETRRQLTRDLDDIEARLRGTAADMRQRLDLLEPARERIRHDVWTSLGLAFGAGLAYALLTARHHDGRRGPLGRVLHSAATQLPAAVFSGVRAGVADRLRHDWMSRRALPAETARET